MAQLLKLFTLNRSGKYKKVPQEVLGQIRSMRSCRKVKLVNISDNIDVHFSWLLVSLNHVQPSKALPFPFLTLDF